MFRPLFHYTHGLVKSLLVVESARTAIDVLPLPRGSMNELRDTARKTLLQALQALNGVNPASYAAMLNQLSAKDECPDEQMLLNLQPVVSGRSGNGYRTSSTLVYDQARSELIYVPPDAADVPGLTASLLDWLETAWEHLPAVVLAGIFQQELLLIQPFEQANGALARLAGEVVLSRKGCGFGGYASAESEIAKDPEAYEIATKSVHSGVYSNPTDFSAWLEFYAATVARAAGNARAQVQARFDASQRPREVGAAPEALVLRDRQRKALEYAQSNGAIRSGEYQKLVSIVPDTARRDFDELIEKGLVEVRGVGRGTHYVLTARGMEEAQRRKG